MAEKTITFDELKLKYSESLNEYPNISFDDFKKAAMEAGYSISSDKSITESELYERHSNIIDQHPNVSQEDFKQAAYDSGYDVVPDKPEEKSMFRKAVEYVAPILEPLRTPVVGLGGLIAGAKSLATGGEFFSEAAKSIEQRRGTGDELIPQAVTGKTRAVSTFVAEMLTDPLNYITLGGASGAARKFVGLKKVAAVGGVRDVVEAGIAAELKADDVVRALDEAKAAGVHIDDVERGNAISLTNLNQRSRALSEKLSKQKDALDNLSIKYADNITPEIQGKIDSRILGIQKSQKELDSINEVINKNIGELEIPKDKLTGIVEPSKDMIDAAVKHLDDKLLQSGDSEYIITKLLQNKMYRDDLKTITRQGRKIVDIEKAGGEIPSGRFAMLKPGEMPVLGDIPASVAAARAAETAAAKDVSNAVLAYKAGGSREELISRIATDFHVSLGARGVISQVGQGLRVLKNKPDDVTRIILSKIKEHLTDNPENVDSFIDSIMKIPQDDIGQRLFALKKVIPVDNSLLAQFREYRGAALLTNPITLLRNIVGNSVAVVDYVAAKGLSGVTYKALGGKLAERNTQDAVMATKGILSGAKEAFNNAISQFKNFYKDTGTSVGFGSEFGTQKAIGGLKGDIIRTPFYLLSSTDTFFKGILANAEKHTLAFRIAEQEGLGGIKKAERVASLVEKPTQEMLDQMIKTAQEYTFQTKLTGDLGSIEKAINGRGIIGTTAKFFIPFFRTPVNVARFAMERVPLVSELTSSGPIRKFLSGASKAELADSMAKNAIGTIALASSAVALHLDSGRITGAPPKNRAEADALYATGWRPYSIKFGDIYIPYRGYEPVASFLSSVADYHANINKVDEKKRTSMATAIVAGSIKNFINQPFLTGLKNVMDALDEQDDASMGRKLKTVFEKQAASLAPTGLGLARGKTIRAPEGIMEILMSKVPILEDRIRPKLTRFGEPMVKTTFAFGLADQPRPNTDVVENELRTLGIPAAVGFPSNHLSGRELSKSEYNKLLTLSGQNIRNSVEQLISNPRYQALPQNIRIGYIKRIVNKERDLAREVVRADAEIRYLNIKESLSTNEARYLSSFIDDVDYQMLGDERRLSVVKDVIGRIKLLRSGK